MFLFSSPTQRWDEIFFPLRNPWKFLWLSPDRHWWREREKANCTLQLLRSELSDSPSSRCHCVCVYGWLVQAGQSSPEPFTTAKCSNSSVGNYPKKQLFMLGAVPPREENNRWVEVTGIKKRKYCFQGKTEKLIDRVINTQNGSWKDRTLWI